MPLLKRLLFVSLVSFFAACSTNIEREVDGESAASKPNGTDIPSKAETSGDGLQGLMDRASREINNGDLDAGLATLERALRIAPRDASIYLSMAIVYRSLDEGSLAANMARRGLLYCERPRLCRQLESLSGQ